MVPDEKSGAGAAPEGFVSISALHARATGSTPADFVRSCPGPALLVLGEGGGGGGPSPGSSSFQIVTLEGASSAASAAARRYHGCVTFVAKRPGNPFPNMISLGRSTSNDVVFGLETVSKLHGYFLRESDAWFFTDYQSTNGTVVNDKKLEKGEKRLLADGDRFRIGLDVQAVFLAAPSLYERLRGGLA